jgi:hypothetical protein
LARENLALQLPFIVHAETTTADSTALEEFGVHAIALPNAKNPKFIGKAAAKKLREMLAEWRQRLPDCESDWARLDSTVSRFGEGFEIPGYAPTSAKGEKRFQLFAMFFFRYVERSPFTLNLLRITTRKPAAGEQPPPMVVIEPGLGDPIRTARGARGFVFRAFTSLPGWAGESENMPRWVQFDFAAFCEALKALHQVEAKGEERKKEQTKKRAIHDYQRGRTKRLALASAEADESTSVPIFAGDPRIARLEWLLSSDPKTGGLAQEYEMSEGVSVQYGLHPRTIRGFRDLRKKWIEKTGDAPFSANLRETLLGLLRDFQRENQNIVGSVRLFEALLDQDNWVIWLEPTATEQVAWRATAKLPADATFATDPLQALTDERERLAEIERLGGPIRFTPADPVHSRRQFYFSDVSALDKKNRLRHDRQSVDVEIALQREGLWSRHWVRLHFTAPRLLRDQLNTAEGTEATFQQAMMRALGLSAGLKKVQKGKLHEASFQECAAVALMPELSSLGEKRILLNFPLSLEDDAIARQLGKKARWHDLQFGGADGESYWLRWPGTWIDEKKARKIAPPAPWWRSDQPFQVLSVDLGQRDAGAFALVESSPGQKPKPQSRKLGEVDSKTWWATVRAMGMLRLPGEDARVIRDGQWQEEFSGSRGRLATGAEWTEARDICAQLGLVADDILSADKTWHSFPEQNDRLLFALRRAQSRLARLQSWSTIAHEDTKPKRREAIIAQINESDDDPLALKPLLSAQQWVRVTGTLCEVIAKERATIAAQLVRIADRIQPLRDRRWEWIPRPNDPANHFLRQTDRGSDDRKKLLAGQRGISLTRVEQLESLRQRCQSLNRALRQNPGAPAKLGRDKRGIELPDPCPELLDRLEALKNQRVNQTAHLILAQALGVRLRPHDPKDVGARDAQDIHGEYERIPGREPVDFIVLENLDRYLASQGRGRSENSRLMKWSHRAILGKLKQLSDEVYGIRVLETPAAYSSKFCSRTGVAGFRAVALNPDDKESYRWKKHLDRLADPERAAKLRPEERLESQRVKRLFDQLDKLNKDLIAERDRARAEGRTFRPKWHTLLAPQQLGPIFVPMRGQPMQADINAAINLGLRAIASPEADDIHVRARAKRDGDRFVVRAENSREKARWGKTVQGVEILRENDRTKLLSEAHVNFFADLGGVATFDQAKIAGQSGYASGRGLWGTINQRDWDRCEDLNGADEIPGL